MSSEKTSSRTGDTWASLGVEIADELRGIIREPTTLFFAVLMPVGLFALFVTIFGSQDSTAVPSVPMGTHMLATFGTFGVMGVALMNPGIGVAADRERGWLRAKRVSAVPIGLTLTAKVLAAMPYAAGVLVAMAATAAVTGSLDAPAGALLRIGAVLLLGSLPFALLSLAVGFQAGSSAAAAILNAILIPSAVLSGLWFPLEIMPDVLQDIAVFLPTYHLAQLALAQLDDGPMAGHLLVLAATTLVMAVLAGLSYRRARS